MSGVVCPGCGREVDWSLLVSRCVADDAEMALMEQCLVECACCLDAYIMAAEAEKAEQTEDQPVPLDSHWVDAVMQAVDRVAAIPAAATETSSKRRPRADLSGAPLREPWHRRAVFHYTVAVGLTVILLVTGGFQQLAGGIGHNTGAGGNVRDIPWSERMVDRTVALIDKLQQ